jgi:hypothetical protein
VVFSCFVLELELVAEVFEEPHGRRADDVGGRRELVDRPGVVDGPQPPLAFDVPEEERPLARVWVPRRVLRGDVDLDGGTPALELRDQGLLDFGDRSPLCVERSVQRISLCGFSRSSAISRVRAAASSISPSIHSAYRQARSISS